MKMNRISAAFAFTMVIHTVSLGQTTLTLQPNAAEGKDAYFKDLTPTLNQGSHPDFSAMAWSSGFDTVLVRSVIDFDFSSIPAGALVNSAYLSLYNNSTSPNNNGQHSSLSGPNTSVLRRITSNWDELSVTWNNQPTTTSINEIQLSESMSSNQDYINIDVTALVQDIINSPSSSFGIMLNLETEQLYRCIIFSSSDHSDPSNHPKLVITYTETNGLAEQMADSPCITVYPNPATNYVMVEFGHFSGEVHSLKLFDELGTLVQSKESIQTGKVKLEKGNLRSGVYWLQLETNDKLIGLKRILLE